ncbi:MAG TPA: decarboxylating 6-phosphogluconate dehydrogenase [Thermoanaerobaculia bacterium]|nr:decarboxylating 6-phosphogluconate dehydrogenase [Thermoanaerobaculia bacterium]
MRLGMIGLGKMGGNMTRRLLAAGHQVVVFDRSVEAVAELVAAGAEGATDLGELGTRLAAPRVVWMMVPAGEVVDTVIESLVPHLEPGDVVVDGGNSFYRDSQRRAAALAEGGFRYVDAGVSGGVWGLAGGYSLMVGGAEDAVALLRPALETLAPAPDRGWGHVGPAGAGHFVKMIHNGIEYGLMQAYAEGFALLHRKTELDLDVAQVAEIWRHGSVVRSWLLDLLAGVLGEDADLDTVAPWVADSGEGRWTVLESLELDSPAPVIALSLIQRLRSRDETSYPDRVLAALRNAFGGHAVKPGEAAAPEAAAPGGPVPGATGSGGGGTGGDRA